MKANRIFKVLHKLHFWLRLCWRRPSSEHGYLRYILHIRYRNSLLFHHRECPRDIFYLGTFRSYTWSCSVTVPLKFWDFKIISVSQSHEEIYSAQILLTAKKQWFFQHGSFKKGKNTKPNTLTIYAVQIIRKKKISFCQIITFLFLGILLNGSCFIDVICGEGTEFSNVKWLSWGNIISALEKKRLPIS